MTETINVKIWAITLAGHEPVQLVSRVIKRRWVRIAYTLKLWLQIPQVIKSVNQLAQHGPTADQSKYILLLGFIGFHETNDSVSASVL
jgi:hypothetical protein